MQELRYTRWAQLLRDAQSAGLDVVVRGSYTKIADTIIRWEADGSVTRADVHPQIAKRKTLEEAAQLLGLKRSR